MTNRLSAVIVAVWLVAGCGDDRCDKLGNVAPRYTLTADGITAEITTAPYQLRVIDGAERVMLETVDEADGYANATWTTGNVVTKAFPTPGYFTFDAALDPWRSLEVVGAEQPSATELVVHLRERGAAAAACPSVSVSYSVSASKLRVEASAAGTPPRAWSAGFATPADEGFLGFGERFNRTNQRGRVRWDLYVAN